MSPSTEYSILVVDDSEPTLEVLRRNLEAEGYRVQTASSVDEAVRTLEVAAVDLVVTDVHMPRVSGLDLVRHVSENLRGTEVCVITGYPNVDGAVSAIKNGATDYLTKPFTDAELITAVRRALERVEGRRAASSGPPASAEHHGLLGRSAAMRRLAAQIERASRTRATTLITGESGTGKELVARAIHYASARAQAPFVPINCGAIPENLLESELFGHVKGAFTGATSTRAGFFLTADGGTVFLDEVGETSMSMQVKLLRVLQDGEVRMVGSSRARATDARVVAATNKDLARLVESGSFREDLFFRLNVLTIDVPPLRERGDDVVLLARHFARRYSESLGEQAPPELMEAALRALLEYGWPGNVRELENVIQRLVVMSDGGPIEPRDLPSLMRFTAPRPPPDLRRTLAEVERAHMRAVLDSVGGNKSQAAQILGVDRKTLRARLRDR